MKIPGMPTPRFIAVENDAGKQVASTVTGGKSTSAIHSKGSLQYIFFCPSISLDIFKEMARALEV